MTTTEPAAGSPQPSADDAGTSGPQSQQSVTSAFAVGWQMAELYHADPIPLGLPEPGELPSRLPGVGALDFLARLQLLADEITVGLQNLAPANPAVPQPDTAGLQALLGANERSAPAVREAVLHLHEDALLFLHAVDFQLGKAYELGRALAETALLPKAPEQATFADLFNPFRLATIRSGLGDLKTSFPPHAAEAVRGSLDAWAAWLDHPTVRTWTRSSGFGSKARAADWGQDRQRINRALRRQGEVWRSLLSGEQTATDLLRATDYVDASARLVARLGELTRRFFWRAAGPLAVVMVVLVVLAGIAIHSGAASTITASAIAAAGAFGVTWKTIGSTLGKAIERAEQPLWKTELDVAAGEAASRLPLASADD